MSSGIKFWGRYYKLTLECKQWKKVFEVKDGAPALDIKFDVRYARGQTAREGTVSILGLSYKTISELLTLSVMTRYEALGKMVHLTLEAGYLYSQSLVQIMDGYVWYATVSSPPNMWVQMKVNEYNPYGSSIVKFDKDPEPMPPRPYIENILRKFSEKEEVDFQIDDRTDGKQFDSDQAPLKFSWKGGEFRLCDAIKELSSQMKDKYILIMRTYAAQSNVRIVEVHPKANEPGVGQTIKIDDENGLLSVTGLDVQGGTVTTFINGDYDTQLSQLKLESDLNPQGNGTYLITQLQHTGHYMGKEWYTRFTCNARKR